MNLFMLGPCSLWQFRRPSVCGTFWICSSETVWSATLQWKYNNCKANSLEAKGYLWLFVCFSIKKFWLYKICCSEQFVMSMYCSIKWSWQLFGQDHWPVPNDSFLTILFEFWRGVVVWNWWWTQLNPHVGKCILCKKMAEGPLELPIDQHEFQMSTLYINSILEESNSQRQRLCYRLRLVIWNDYFSEDLRSLAAVDFHRHDRIKRLMLICKLPSAHIFRKFASNIYYEVEKQRQIIR